MEHASSNEYTVPAGPLRGYDLAISTIEHDIDAHEDRLTLDLWAADAVAPTHTFETYRHGYGFTQLQAGLSGPAQMAAVANWWLASSGSLVYSAHRILVAVDTGTTLGRLATALQLDSADLNRPGHYRQALDSLVIHGLLAVDAAGRYTPTREVDALLRPDDQAHGYRMLRWFTNLLQIGHPPASETAAAERVTAPATPAARAFPTLRIPDAARPTPISAAPRTTSTDQTAARRGL